MAQDLLDLFSKQIYRRVRERAKEGLTSYSLSSDSCLDVTHFSLVQHLQRKRTSFVVCGKALRKMVDTERVNKTRLFLAKRRSYS
jgi:hypothetical protein